VLAAKRSVDAPGAGPVMEQENSGGPQLLAQPVAQPPRPVARAVPFTGNVRPDALVPGVVQPWPVPCAPPTLPWGNVARPVTARLHPRLLRGRDGQ